jgi:hypothetical protein
MKLRSFLAASLVGSLALVAGPAPSGIADGPALPGATATCSGVWVVVDRGNGESTTRCATNYATGLTALASAGFTVAETQGYVAQIHGHPATPDASSFTNYWSYWHADRKTDGTFSTWGYSNQGASAYHPAQGSVEGWRFGDGGKFAPTTMPPRGYSSAPTPKISGKAKKGLTLHASIATWRPTPQLVRLQWYRSGRPIVGASMAKYQLGKADIGKSITVRVTVSGAGLQTVTQISKATKKVRK